MSQTPASDTKMQAFLNLLSTVTLRLNEDAAVRPKYYLTRNAQLLEDDVLHMLESTAAGTCFAGKVKKISGQRFPDIVVDDRFGVEVKSSKDDKWITLGGSINESTRVDGVEHIFLIFGTLKEPIEFRTRPYEECISEVVVTHYPRYKIDMELDAGATIFDAMHTSYDALRLDSDPVDKIVDYYRSQLRAGESLWWTGRATQENPTEAAPMTIRFWSTLPAEEQLASMILGIILFPELLGKSSKRKYERFSLWLAANHGVLSTSTRDAFSAGGQGALTTKRGSYASVPRILLHVHEHRMHIEDAIALVDESVLQETWKTDHIRNDRIEQWIECVEELCRKQQYSVETYLNAIFDR